MRSNEMRRLNNAWNQRPWPQHLEWIEISGLRGWEGQRLDFHFPIVALVGENGTGKSTVIQAAASSYRGVDDARTYYASTFFPDTPWERVSNVNIRASVRQGNQSFVTSVRKPSTRWRGNPERRQRHVEYLDLRRTQPIYARTGYGRLAKHSIAESEAEDFDAATLRRLASVLGRDFTRARQSLTNADPNRRVPVVSFAGQDYSGFHQGAGESTVADLLALPLPQHGLILIDEIETSLHPRAQRRLVRDLAARARVEKLQIVVTTHSPYILEELPETARLQIIAGRGGKRVVRGVSPEFALSRMDEDLHPEADVYVEDSQARILVEEILAASDQDLLARVAVTTYGAASVGQALGQMVEQGRFARPTVVFLDGDQESALGCHQIPGEDAPEREVFTALESIGWADVARRINRSHSRLVDAAQNSMTIPDHHEWIGSVADGLVIGGRDLWRAMCITYANECLTTGQREEVATAIRDTLDSR